MKEKLAFVFPGQGSQSVGMLNDFNESHPEIVAQVCAEASEVLGYDVGALIAENAQGLLDRTEYTQPALLVAGVIAWRVWMEDCEGRPEYLAGHSLGEYTALVCAGALSLADGLRLVVRRGQLMQGAVASGVGSMAAILGLELAQVEDVCALIMAEVAAGELVQVANINAPGQVVIAGTKQAVEVACERAKAAGAKRAVVLAVSVPSHCGLMRGMADEFAVDLARVEWRKPNLPVVRNVDFVEYSDVSGIADALQRQLYCPVQWVRTVEYLRDRGVTEIVECGPGKVLTGLNKRIAPEVKVRAIVECLEAGIC